MIFVNRFEGFFEICVFYVKRVVLNPRLCYAYSMNKRLLCLLLVLILAVSIGTLACDNVSDDAENPDDTTLSPVEPSTPDNPATPSIPHYTRTEVNGIDTVYFGSAFQTAESKTISATLRNLIADGMISPDENGIFEYGGTTYIVLTADSKSTEKTFSDGTSIADGEMYFFKKEAVAWRVLSEDENTLTLISEKAITSCVFRQTGTFNSTSGVLDDGKTYANDYATSYVRAYLNGEFLSSVFGEDEKHILTSEVSMSADGSSYDGAEDKDTLEDKAYLLSYSELVDTANGLTPATDYTYAVELTDYAVFNGANAKRIGSDTKNYTAWWLRSEGNKKAFATCVPYTGITAVKEELYRTVIMQEGVRPVIKIEK